MATLTAQPDPEEFVYSLTAHGGLFLAGSTSGLYRSEDDGQTWRPATESLGLSEPVPATAALFSPDYDGDHTIVAGMAGGILRSGDAGAAWALANTPPPPPTITAMAVSPNFVEDGVLLAGTMEDGILRSSDRGYRWALWNFGLLDLSIFSLAISPDFARDDTIYAGAETGIFCSTNGGRAWREVDLPVGFETVLCLGISPDFAADDVLYAGTETHGLLVSHDRGATWAKLGEGVLESPVNSIYVSPDYAQRKELVVLCSGAAWLSRDGGQRWSALWPELSAAQEITALLAPQGFAPGVPAWLGLVGGEVRKIQF